MSKARRNKIFLIGNGFDLAHRLPTRYTDFIKWYLECCCIKAIYSKYDDDCVSVEIRVGSTSLTELEIVGRINQLFLENKFWDFIVNYKTNVAQYDYSFLKVDDLIELRIDPINDFCLNLLLNCQEADWSGIEYEINRIMLKEHSSLIESRMNIMIDRNNDEGYKKALKNMQDLNKSVYCLKTQLIEYLKENNNPSECKVDLILNHINNDWGSIFTAHDATVFADGKPYRRLDIDFRRQVLFLNFNYTTYFEDNIVKKFQDQFEDQYTDVETIYIHGDLDSPTDDIVFGVGDENKEIYSELESLYDNDWLVPLKSFHYFRNKKYQELLGFIAKGDYEITVIGHSCSTTDRTLLNMLFENDACKKIHVYHYSGIDSYLTTAYNIARNFNDKVRLRKVLQPFNPDLTTR